MAHAIIWTVKRDQVAELIDHRKTLEPVKRMPKYGLPTKVYVYYAESGGTFRRNGIRRTYDDGCGKIIGFFVLNDVIAIRHDAGFAADRLTHEDILERSCMTNEEFDRRMGTDPGYAWVISCMTWFEKPIDIKMFKDDMGYPIKPPKSWKYVEEENE